MTTPLWSDSEFAEVTSYLTGRTMYVNSGTKYVVPPSFTPEKLQATLAEYETYLAEKYKKPRHRKLPVCLGVELTKMATVKNAQEFGRIIERFLRSRPTKHEIDIKARQTDLLTRLWQNDCLIWPLVYAKEYNFSVIRAWGLDGETLQLITDFKALQDDSETGKARVRGLITLLLATSGARSVGDLTPEVTSNFFRAPGVQNKLRLSTSRDLVKLQAQTHANAMAHQIADYGKVGRFATRGDNDFAWVMQQDPTLLEWVQICSSYMATIHTGVAMRRNALNSFLTLLIGHSEVTRLPQEFFRHDYRLPDSFVPKGTRATNGVHLFFEWVLNTRFVAEDDYGAPMRLPGFRNPIIYKKENKNNAETHRNPMPTRFVRMLIEVLTENDFAWPRAYGVSKWNGKGGDYIRWPSPETGIVEEVWSPTRTIAILIKLLLPSRTYQVRMLDSGEGDSESYRPDSGCWVKNAKAANDGNTVNKGVFYRHRDGSGKESVFLRFNTNKTADVDDPRGENGYVMPWEHGEAIKLLAYLRDWQEKYNSQVRPTPWVDIKEQDVSARFSKERLERRGATYFLFRDACSSHRDQPVTDSRLIVFWRNLNAELERRLAEAGETMHDGSPINLVNRMANGGVGPATFDLHTLRVTIITAMAESGGVPIEVLMKVVGHASVIMTMYYVKLSATHISKTLNEAQLEIHNEEQRNWQNWLTQQSRDVLLQSVAHNSMSAVQALEDVSPASWVIRDHGICPVGCSRCHEGGPVAYESTKYKRHQPVPGGASGCVRCRFFITGPAFLLGLQAYFDNIGWRLREASGRYQNAKERFETLAAEYNGSRSAGQPVTKQQTHLYDVAASNLDQQTLAVDNQAHLWHAAYRLIEQCLGILRHKPADGTEDVTGQYALIAVGGMADLDVALEECSEFDQVDRICQSAVFFESLDATMPNLRRMRVFEAMLKRNGCEPVFIELSEQEALMVGNQLAAFLYNSFGREQTNALMAGRETLQRLGIERDTIHQITAVSPETSRRLQMATPPIALTALTQQNDDYVTGGAP